MTVDRSGEQGFMRLAPAELVEAPGSILEAKESEEFKSVARSGRRTSL